MHGSRPGRPLNARFAGRRCSFGSWLNPCCYAFRRGDSTPSAGTQSVTLMDTRVTERQKRRNQRCLPRIYGEYWWCATLCVLACGCDLLKPTTARQAPPPPGAATAAQSNNPVATPPTPLVRATASPADPASQSHPAPQSPAAPNPIATPRPSPTFYSAPADPPPKGAQLLLGSSASAKAQTKHTVTNSAAKAPMPQTTVTYVPRERGAAILIKGPPRRPEPRWSRKAVPLCLALSTGALLVALVFRVKQRLPPAAKPKRKSLYCRANSNSKIRPSNPKSPSECWLRKSRHAAPAESCSCRRSRACQMGSALSPQNYQWNGSAHPVALYGNGFLRRSHQALNNVPARQSLL